MSDNIYENQPCYWASTTSGTEVYPSDTVGGATATTRSASVFNGGYRNARIQTIALIPNATGDVATVYDDAGNAIGTFKAGGTETHTWDIGGDVGVFAANGFKFKTSAGTATVFWRYA